MRLKYKSNFKIFVLVSLILGHFTVDWYSGILRPLLPQIMTRFSLTMGQVALIPSVLGIATAFFQPLSAALGEIIGEKYIVLFSILLSVIFIPLMGISKSILIFLVVLSIGLLGNSMFHPNAASLVGKLKFKKQHTAMSVFSIGGTIGSGLAPIMVVLFVSRFGFVKMPFLSVPGILLALIIAVFLFIYKPKYSEKISTDKQDGKIRNTKGVPVLLSVNILRSLAIIGFSTLIPLYLRNLGYTEIWGGYFLTASRFSGAFGTYLGATISDRVGPKFVNQLSLFIGSLFALLFLVFHNVYLMLISFFIAFFFWFFTMGANVSYMQNLLPHKKGMASSLGMGISWGTASILLSGLSLIIDFAGIYAVLFIVFLSSVAAFFLSFGLYEPKNPDYKRPM